MDAALLAKVKRALEEHQPPAPEVEFAGYAPWTLSKLMMAFLVVQQYFLYAAPNEATVSIISAWMQAALKAYETAGAGATMLSAALFDKETGVLAAASPLLGKDGAAMASSMLISLGAKSDDEVLAMYTNLVVTSQNAGKRGWPAIKVGEPVGAYIMRCLNEAAVKQAAGAGAGAGADAGAAEPTA